MTTKTTRRWWPSWKRQTERPERLERRNPSGFGHECVEAIYQILFPDILEDGGLDTATKMQTSNCFENGAFVFEDNDQSLFKILIGDNGTGTRTDNEYGKLEGRKTTRFSSRKTLTHLIPAFLKKQGSKKDWNNITFIFYGPNGTTTEVPPAPLGNIVQYEREVAPAIKFLCNPQCRRDPLPYCHELNIQHKPHGKGVMKFYSYSIHYRVSGRQAPHKVGPYTYVKLESLPVSPQLDIFKQGAQRHKSRTIQKTLTRRRQNKAAVAALMRGHCLKVANSGYCYRAEDLGYIKAGRSWPRDSYNNAHNSFQNLSPDSITTIKNYTNSKVWFADKNRDIYKLRTGHELFVPQEMTARIIQQLRENAARAVVGGGGGAAAAAAAQEDGGDAAAAAAAGDNEGHKREYIWSESATRYGGGRRKRRKRTRRRRKRRRTRKRRHTIRHSTKKRNRRK